MRKFDWLVVGIFLAACCTFPKPPRPESEVGPGLLTRYGPSVVKLTPPNISWTGGTGFYLKTPSGNTVTITNGHVCGVSPDKHWMQATDDSGNDRELLEIKEISETADLCILSGPKDLKSVPLELNDYQTHFQRLWALGHPHLKPNTLTNGYIVGYSEITLNESDLSEAECKPPTRIMEQGGCVRKIWAYDTSIVIYPGNSGSPVLTDEGKVVGVMFAGDGRTNNGVFISLSDLKALVSRY